MFDVWKDIPKVYMLACCSGTEKQIEFFFNGRQDAVSSSGWLGGWLDQMMPQYIHPSCFCHPVLHNFG
jgi:hypothetical protein